MVIEWLCLQRLSIDHWTLGNIAQLHSYQRNSKHAKGTFTPKAPHAQKKGGPENPKAKRQQTSRINHWWVGPPFPFSPTFEDVRSWTHALARFAGCFPSAGNAGGPTLYKNKLMMMMMMMMMMVMYDRRTKIRFNIKCTRLPIHARSCPPILPPTRFHPFPRTRTVRTRPFNSARAPRG